MDWNLIWTAAAVVIPVLGVVIGCFMSLTRQIAGLSMRVTGVEKSVENLDRSIGVISGKVDVIDQRLSRLEGAFEERGRWESRKTS